MNNTLNEIIDKLNKSEKVAIFCHARPDGDTLGSGIALSLILKNLGKFAVVCCDDTPPEKFSFLPDMSGVKSELPQDINFDTFVSVDCADLNRLGTFQKVYSKFKFNTINIDHHISNDGYAKYNYVLNVPATCELLTEMFIKAGWEVTENIANYLMLGLVTDSGNFVHQDVTPKTFEAGAFLRSRGADVHKINYYMFERQPKARALLYGRIMNKIRFALGDKFAYIVIKKEDMDATGADMSLTEGFVDFPLTIDGVEVSASIMEYKSGQYKASLRSKGTVNVNSVATSFGGGGHVLASGCMIYGSEEEVIDKLTYAVYQNL